MTFYYQCECGERINKIAAEDANSDEEARDLFSYYKGGEPLVQCPKCGTKYKMKKLPRKNINIAIFLDKRGKVA